MQHQEIMRLALQQAELAVKVGNAPFGCVVTDKQGEVILKEHDRVNQNGDLTAHGEINAIRLLCKQLSSLSLSNYIFYTTSEPCPLCMAAMIKAHVSAVFFGAARETTASLPLSAKFMASKSHKYPIVVTGGILANECLKQRTLLKE